MGQTKPNIRENTILTTKVPSKICSRRHFKIYLYIYLFIFSEKISVDISCESSARQMIHLKCQDLFSLKNMINNITKQTCSRRHSVFF